MSREKFEAWWVSENDGHQPRSSWSALRTDDGYNDEDIDLQWQGYQAATASMQSERDQLAAQLADVVAENVSLREYRPQPSGAAMMEALDSFYEYHEDVPEQGMMAAFEILCCKRPQTPATDRFLAEQRALGVDNCAAVIQQQVWDEREGDGIVAALDAMEIYAALLRNEVKV